MMSRALSCALAVAICAAGCKHAKSFSDAPPPGDAGNPDGNTTAQGAPGREVTSGAGHLTGSSYQLDVQVGHGTSQGSSSGSSVRIEGNAPVKP